MRECTKQTLNILKLLRISMITIELLEQHQTDIPILAKLWHELLGKIWVPDVSIERVEQKFYEHCNEDKLPLAFVARENGQPIGMCALRENDGIRPDLTPWLGSLMVDKRSQHHGVGQLLVDAVKVKAKTMGFETLYLFAFDPTIPAYYERLGWKTMGMDEFKGHRVTVMMIGLS